MAEAAQVEQSHADGSRTSAAAEGLVASVNDSKEPHPYCIVNFYHLVDISQPRRLIKESGAFLEGKDIRGRIYISEQGINAQYGGEKEQAVAYAEWLKATQPQFQGLRYSVDAVDEHMFPKLRLKYRPNLISLAGGMQALPVTQAEHRAVPLEPHAWRRMIESGRESKHAPLILDIRNSYEWDAGHFEGAERPLEVRAWVGGRGGAEGCIGLLCWKKGVGWASALCMVGWGEAVWMFNTCIAERDPVCACAFFSLHCMLYVCVLQDEFNETPTEATPTRLPAQLEAAEPDTPVMMYCTGGIRCDIYSTYLKQKG
jgi:rhodanese-related sulfurtransferase